MRRRKFVKIAGGTALIGGGTTLFTSCDNPMVDDMMDMNKAPKVIEGPFTRQLPLPASMSANGANLTAQRTTMSIVQGKDSSVLGYQAGHILGPTLRTSTGDNVNVLFQNNLNESSNVHWHGLITPPEMDGHPKDIVAVGNSFTYAFPVVNRAGTYWYHPHPDMMTAKQAYEGLAGLLIISDPEEEALNLPNSEYEIPLVIQDKKLDATGDLHYAASDMDIMNGLLGETILINGIHSPYTEVVAGIYRLRILNGSNGRIYNLELSNGISFMVIGSDGGLLATPETTDLILLGPGERVDVLVNFEGLTVGTDVYLSSNTFDGGDYQGHQSYKLLKFRIKSGQSTGFTTPGFLSNYSAIPESQSSADRFFDITNGGGHGGHGAGMIMHNINGKSYDVNRIDETVFAGTIEAWTFFNTTGIDPHPMHLHGVLFQVLDRTGGRGQVLPHERGWKDTVLVMPGEKVRVIVPINTDYKGIYVFHCHNLEHEDSGMMLQMEIK